MSFLLQCCEEHKGWLSLDDAYSKPANQSHISVKKCSMDELLGSSN